VITTQDIIFLPKILFIKMAALVIYRNNTMYKKQSFGGRRNGFFNRNKGGGSRFGGGGNRFGGGGRGGFSGSRIDINKFINKATPATQEEKYQSTHTFADFAIDEKLKQNIISKGYIDPLPIQDQAIPQLLEGKDMIGIANTGTGKTAAFLIPLINKIIKNRNERVLIIAPTRELAEQIESELTSMTAGLGIYSALCIGGMSMGRQISNLRRSPHFVIGTPGRLKDMTNRRFIYLDKFTNVVLDEVDRMFDMGFMKDIKFLLDPLPKTRQSLFFSATITPDIERLINQYSTNPVKVTVKTRETAASVDQDIVRISGQIKIQVLHDLLIKEDFTKILIFGRTKHGVHKLSEELQVRGFKAESIHGDKSQSQRQRVLKQFKVDEINILVATDVAARGLDIPNVSHVINYELPQTYEDYVHRIGRTGRANQTGKALTFV
jgi:ATP-dependent RNA helicase RhlE